MYIHRITAVCMPDPVARGTQQLWYAVPYVWEKLDTSFIVMSFTKFSDKYLFSLPNPTCYHYAGLSTSHSNICKPHPELPSTATSTCYYSQNIMVTSYFENKCTVINYIREHFTSKECCVCECCEVHTNTQAHTCSQARIHTNTHIHMHTRTYICAHTHMRAHTYARTHICAHTHTHTHTRVFKSHGH